MQVSLSCSPQKPYVLEEIIIWCSKSLHELVNWLDPSWLNACKRFFIRNMNSESCLRTAAFLHLSISVSFTCSNDCYKKDISALAAINDTEFCLIRRNRHVFITIYMPGVTLKILPLTSVEPQHYYVWSPKYHWQRLECSKYLYFMRFWSRFLLHAMGSESNLVWERPLGVTWANFQVRSNQKLYHLAQGLWAMCRWEGLSSQDPFRLLSWFSLLKHTGTLVSFI